MRHYRITPASRDAAAERRAQARRDAGIPDRPALVSLPQITLDLRGCGGPHWRAEHKPGTCQWHVYDADTGARVMRCQAGAMVAAAHASVPRMLSARSAW